MDTSSRLTDQPPTEVYATPLGKGTPEASSTSSANAATGARGSVQLPPSRTASAGQLIGELAPLAADGAARLAARIARAAGASE